MISINVSIAGEKEVINYIDRISKQLPKAGTKVIRRYADFVSRSAKVRASMGWAASGETARSIKVSGNDKDKYNPKLTISMDSKAAPFQEFGFKPHWVQIKYLSDKAKRNLANWKNSRYNPKPHRKGVGNGGFPGYIYVTKSTPIFSPAVEKANERLDSWIEEEVNNAIK